MHAIRRITSHVIRPGSRTLMFRALPGLVSSAAILLALSAPSGSAAAEQHSPSVTGEWRIAAIATPGGALVDLDGDTALRTEVTIDRHGLWAASAGCNRLRGTLEQHGRTLDVSDRVMATKMDCKGPTGDLERRFMRYFPAAVQVDGMPGRVLLRDGSGAAVVLLVGK
jgi:heat shock protein HslJ